MQPGVHEIFVQKLNADGSVADEYTTYKMFSYSAEYNIFIDTDKCSVFLEQLAEDGHGLAVTESWQIFDQFVRVLHIKYDPRIPFIITAIVLFLLDIAVRKFKFKWIHELIRERREKRDMK